MSAPGNSHRTRWWHQFRYPRTYRKATMAGFIAALAALGSALTDNSISPSELVGIIVAGLAGSGLTYSVRNDDRGPR